MVVRAPAQPLAWDAALDLAAARFAGIVEDPTWIWGGLDNFVDARDAPDRLAREGAEGDHRVEARDHAGGPHGLEPGRVEADLGLLRIEDLEHLLAIGLEHLAGFGELRSRDAQVAEDFVGEALGVFAVETLDQPAGLDRERARAIGLIGGEAA